jgi:hypothetical protein
MFAYSTRRRLTHIYGDAIDYSEVAGHDFLAEFADSAGIWLDYGYRSGRKITLPPRLAATPVTHLHGCAVSPGNRGARS